jgi:hypothetical protein
LGLLMHLEDRQLVRVRNSAMFKDGLLCSFTSQFKFPLKIIYFGCQAFANYKDNLIFATYC